LYAGLLGLLIVLERLYRGKQAVIAIFLTALVLATTTRFRIHIAVAVLPAFLLITLYLWRKKRQNVFLLAGFAAAVVAGLLYFELRSPVYLPETANVRFGYSGLTADPTLGRALAFWPFSGPVHEWLRRTIRQPDVIKWTWEVTCVSMFSLLIVIGIPLLVATFIYLRSDRARTIFALFNFLIIWAVVTSICFAVVLSSTYDTIAMQYLLPFHTRWYVFPFEGVALWYVARFVQKKVRWPTAVWNVLATIILAGGLLYRVKGPPSPLTVVDRKEAVSIRPEEYRAFLYLKERTSPDSVVLTTRHSGFYQFGVSGLSGRAAYLELPGSVIDRQAVRLHPRDDRTAIMNALLSASSDEKFSQLIRSTPITYIVEFRDHPLPVHPSDCLTRVWENTEHTVIIWQVTRNVHASAG
jgi:hypothetical protein